MTSSAHVYLRPRTVVEALGELAAAPLTILAGGTDFYAARSSQPIAESVLDVTAILELGLVRDEGSQWRIGATVTWTDLIRADLPPQFRGLQAAARQVGGVQVQNAGTVGGNICNASPAADGIPALLALDAQIEVSSLAGVRALPLNEFVLGPRKTVRRADELVTGILVPARGQAKSSFIKLGPRRYLVVSIAMVSAVIDVDVTGRILYAGIAVGACSPVARRLGALEKKLVGQQASPDLSAQVQPQDLAALSPIDDVRGTAAYRRDVALTLVIRAIEEALRE